MCTNQRGPTTTKYVRQVTYKKVGLFELMAQQIHKDQAWSISSVIWWGGRMAVEAHLWKEQMWKTNRKEAGSTGIP